MALSAIVHGPQCHELFAKYKSGCRNKLYLLSYADYLETKVFSGISVTVTYLTSSSYSYSNTK